MSILTIMFESNSFTCPEQNIINNIFFLGKKALNQSQGHTFLFSGLHLTEIIVSLLEFLDHQNTNLKIFSMYLTWDQSQNWVNCCMNKTGSKERN